MATELVSATKTSEIPAGSVTAIDVRGKRIAVANVSGTYFAFDDACTHEQCSLAEYGELAGTTLTCTCHGSEFDVRTGKVLAPPATVPVKVYPVRVAGDAVTDRGVMAPRYVIVGASLAGATAAIILREEQMGP